MNEKKTPWKIPSIFHAMTSWIDARRKTRNHLALSIETLEDRMMLNGDLGESIFAASFEDAQVDPGKFAFVQMVSGFQATGNPVEIQNDHPSVGPASQGQKHLELDGDNGIYVDLNASSTDNLKLRFDYSARPGVSAEQNAIEIHWDGELIETVSADGQKNRSTAFREFELNLEGGAGRLEFRSAIPGAVRGLGGLLDNIRVNRIVGPIEIASIPDQTLRVGDEINLQASLLPPDQNLPGAVYRLIQGPPGLQLDSATGEIRWTASQENVDLADSQNDSTIQEDPVLVFQSGFEDVDVRPGGFAFTRSVSGFTATGPPVEIQHNHPAVGPGSEGQQHLELDKLNGISRNVETVVGDQYELVIDYSPRPGVGLSGNTIEIWWDGKLIDSVSKNGTNRKTQFSEYRLDLSDFTGNLTQLEFRSNDPTDEFGLGGLLDNVRLYRTSETIIDGPDGKYEVIIEVSDNQGRSDRESFAICIDDAVNRAPSIAPILDQTINEGESFSLNVVASDPDFDTLTYSLESLSDSSPAASIDPNTGEISWTTTELDGPGVFEFAVSASDPNGLSDTENFLITVAEVNLPPSIDSVPDQEIDVEESVSLTVTASDPDVPSNLLTFSLGVGSPANATLNEETGEFNWTPTESDANATYPITVWVTDEAGASDSTSFNIIVGEPADRPPVIQPIETQNINEGDLLEIQVQAMDPDDQPLNYTITQGMRSGVTLDPVTGQFRFEPTEAEGPGEYDFEITVSDGTLNSTVDFTVVVNEVNLAPQLIVPDEIANGSLTLDLRSTLSLDFDATDPDLPANALLFSLEEPTTVAQIDPDTGVFTLFPTSDLVDQTLNFSVIVRDSGSPSLSDRHSFSILIDSCPFDDELSLWTTEQNGGSASDMGFVTASDCVATISEGDSFEVTLETSFVVQQNKAVQFSYSDLNFDTTDPAFINDAFEVALLGTNGQSLVNPFADNRDAFFNVSEGLPAAIGEGILIDGNTVTVGLNGLAVGTEARLVFRLVNNDSDTTTKVTLNDFQIIDSVAQASRRIPTALASSNSDPGSPVLTTTSRDPDNTFDLPVVVTGGETFIAPDVTAPQPLTPSVEWSVSEFDVLPEFDQVMMAPAVFDMNQDGVPDIIFSTFTGSNFNFDSVLRVISGADGSPIWTLDDPAYRVGGAAGVAVGDIDNDGLPEILARHESFGYLAVEHDGTVKWLSNDLRIGNSSLTLGSAALADLDHDGNTEIVVGSTVLDNQGNILWKGAEGFAYGQSAVADLDRDGDPEIVTGTTAYRANGDIYWDFEAPLSETGFKLAGFPAIGNFDSDPFPEIAISIDDRLELREHDGTLIWNSPIPGDGGGAPTIADFDGDGKAEIGVAGARNYVVFEGDGTVKWTSATQDFSSERTGSSVFDFDSDGRAEVVYGDETTLRIYDGETGEVRFSLPKSSRTTFELPIVVDVDGDGIAEIVAVANDFVSSAQKGIFVIGDDENWSTTRQIWNQHTYHITNINDDGSIPAYELNSWEIYNNYRRNEQPTGKLLGEPLITARASRGGMPAGSQTILTGEAIAQGMQSSGIPNVIAAVTVNGRPVDQLDSTGQFFTSVDLLPGENQFIFEAVDVAGQSTQAQLTVVGTQFESEVNFNQFADITQSIEGVYARTSFDKLNKTLFVDLVANNEGTFPANGPLLVGVKNISEPSVTLLDRDGVTPDGMPYFDLSELLTGDSLESGNQSGTATIKFFNPRELQFDYDLVFLAQINNPPEIISNPIVEAFYDEEYIYDVEATDPNEDTLVYSLVIASPGMTIDAATGVISWSPTINEYGLHDVAIEVADGRGGKAEQRFTINVTEAPPNRPPIIVSNPVTAATLPGFELFPVDEMVLNKDAALVETQDGEVIRISPAARNKNGSAFSQTERSASEFSAAFTFRISDSSGPAIEGNPAGADGMAFVIQSISNTVGSAGGGIGYAGIRNSVAVEFDTFQNPNTSQFDIDPSSNHVAITIDGNARHNNEFVVTIEEPLDNGELWYAWVDYDGVELQVRLSQENIRPKIETLSRTLDIPGILNQATAFFGFTAASGDSWSNHDLIQWRFNDEYSPLDNNTIGDYVIDWQTEAIQVSNTLQPALNPTIAVDQDGILHLAYREGPDRGNGWYENMFYASLQVDGTLRTAPINIESPGWNGSGSLVIDDQNRPVLALHAWNVAPGEEVLLTTLDENGVSTGFIQATDTPRATNTDLPQLAVGNEGEIFLVWQDEENDPVNNDQNRRRDLFFQKLKFEGSGYVLDGEPIEVTTDEGTGFGNVGFVNNFGGIAVDQSNQLHIAWADWRDSTDFNQTEIYYEVLAADGTTVVDETRISTLGGTPATRPQIRVDSTNNGHVLWIEKREQADALVHAIVDDMGHVVSTRDLYAGEPDSVSSFSATIDEFDQLHILRSDATGVTNTINYHRFNHAGDLLIDSLQVSETDADVTFNASYPAIAVSGKDTFSIVWDERTEQGTAAETSVVLFKSFTIRSTAVVTYRYDVVAVDADDDPLVFGLLESPSGMTINPNSGVILWSPAQGQEGDHDVTVEVSDPSGAISIQSFTVCVFPATGDQPRQVTTTFNGDLESRLVNDAPTITSVPRTHAIQGETYSYDAIAIDLNGDALRWNLDSAPIGMSVDSDTGQISWTPTDEQFGDYLVVLTAYDSVGASATQRYQVHVGCYNLAPAIVSIPPTAALTQRDYFYAVHARDVEGDLLSWSLESAPESMTIDGVRGFIRWQPTVGQIGSHEIIINVSDGNSTAKQFYTLVVTSADDLIDPNDPSKGTKGNRAPLITSTPQLGAVVDQLYQYQIEAIDLDGHDISFRLVGTPPEGMSFNPEGLLTWTPTLNDSGDVAVNIQAVDEFGAIASQGFVLKVETNSAPTIESTPPETVVEGRTYRYLVNAIDVDGDELNYELVDGPEGMAIDQQIGILTWSTFDHPVAAGTTVGGSVRVTDSFGHEAIERWQIEVLADTAAPIVSIAVISTQGVFFGETAEFKIGQPYQVQVLASDNARVTDLTLRVDGTLVPLDRRGFATIMPTQSGVVELVATATDSAGLTGTDQTTVVLLNEAPEFISEAPVFAAANEDFFYPVVASDAEGHEFTFSITSGPVGATIDPFSGIVAIDGADFSPGNYDLVVRATDEFGAFSEQTSNFDAIDLSINHAPIFLTQPPTEIPAGLFFFYVPETLDYNGDTVTYRLLEGSAEFRESDGRLRFRTPFTPQEIDFVLQADDGNGGITTQAFTVNVTPANRAPVFLSQPTVRVKAGELYAYAPVVSDPNGDDFTLYIRSGPREQKPGDFFSSWSMDIGEDNVLRWQTDLDDVGSHYVRIGALDPWSEWGHQSFTLEVVEDLTSPLVEILATPNPAEVGDVINVQVIAEDDGTIEALTLSLEGDIVELDAEGRGTVSATRTGNFEFLATATDNDGNTTERVVPLQVRDLSDIDAPIVSISSPASETVITSFTDVIGSVSDANLDFYSLSYRPLAGGSFVEFLRSDQTVDDGVLGTFDPSTLANDTYVVRLYARDVNGKDAFVDTVVDVMGELKLGNFKLSFADMTIPIGAIPVIVGRTYDSLNANQQGEFGYGWRLEFRDVDLRTSVAPSGTEDLGFYRPFKDGSRVYLTLPGGKREGFTFKVERAGGLRGALGIHFGSFEADPGVKTQLTVQQFELAFDSEANVYTWGSGQAYNPSNSIFGGKYYATTEDGILFEIDGNTGDLERVIDTNGNVITYSDKAIVSSSGQRVDFVRDDLGRIVQAIDPEGNAIKYAYDDQGNLVSVTDREGNTTSFKYDAPRPHYLSEIIDPLGRTGVRTEYDETGKLIRMFDVNGNMTQLVHDPDNFVEQIIDPLGNTTTYEYDERGNVLKEIDALGGVTTTTYDIENNEISVTDAFGNTTEMAYSATSDLLSTTDALGNVTTKTYDRIQPRISLGSGLSFGGFLKPFSIETTTTNAVGDVSAMGYDSQGNLTSMTNAAGETNTFAFDASGAATSISRAGTTPQTFEYDGAGNLIESVDAFGNTTFLTYDGNGAVLTETTNQTLADGTVVVTRKENTYDNEGRTRFRRSYEDGVMITENESRYNAVGKLIEQIDTLGRSTKYVYNDRGLLIETIYPDTTPGDDSDNPRTKSEFDVLGRTTARIDELGRRTEYVYDAVGRLIMTVFPDATPEDPTDNPRTQTVYDLAGRPVAQIDELGNRTETIFDAAGRAIFTLLPDDTPDDATDNPRIETVYNAAGQQVEQIDPLGNRTTFEYENGRPVRTIFADGTSTENIYNDIGIVVATIDKNGIRTDFEYDDQGRLLAVVSAEVDNPETGLAKRPRTEYEYDSRGNLLIQRDALGRETTYFYDARGRRISTSLPLGQTASSEYNVIGGLSATTDFDGETTNYVYDERNRLTSKIFADGTTIDMTYTLNGLVETSSDSRGITSYTYDERDRLILQTNPDATSLAYTYDAAGNRTSISVPSGTTSYTYDARNRIKTVTDPDGDATTYIYNAINLIRTTFANGTTESRVYDALNRLTYLENSGPNGIINSVTYGLDGVGNRRGVLEADGRRVNYVYDDLYRLTRESITDPVNGDRVIQYVYDMVGNRLERDDSVDGVTNYVYDSNDRLLSETTTSEVTEYAYDENGNTLNKQVNGELATTYFWDAENRLVAADTDGDGTIDVTNEYDASGVRVSQTVDDEMTNFLVDSTRPFAQVVEEYTDGGVIKVSYIFGRDLISQNRPASSGKSIYHIDGLGSTRALTDSTGVVTDRYIFDAFGRTLAQVGSTGNVYLFAGEQRDVSLGLDYLRARYLNPATGRFVSRDPAPSRPSMPLTANRYSYVENNPVNLIDPSGYSSLGELSTAQTIASVLVGLQGVLSTGTLLGATLSNDIVESNFITFSASNSRFTGTIFAAKTQPLPRYPEGLIQFGFMLGAGASTSSDVGFEASTGTTFSPGVFFHSKGVAKAAFMPIFVYSAFGLTIGPLGAGFGGGFIGFSAIDLSGFSLAPSLADLDGGAVVFAGVSVGLGNAIDCRDSPLICNLAQIELGGPTNEDLLNFIFNLYF